MREKLADIIAKGVADDIASHAKPYMDSESSNAAWWQAMLDGAGRPPPDEAQCDPCGRMVPKDDLATVIAYGIETVACSDCRSIA